MLRAFAFFPACALYALLAASAQGQSATQADADPIAFFASLAELPTEQQDAFLQMAGQSLMNDDSSITCNIFGGEDACKTVSADSEFASNCQAYREDLKVDCAYYSSSEEHLDTHPGDALNKFLGASYNTVTQDCPQCLTSLQALWCVQALPECGSFQTHVHKAIFPAFVAAKKAEDAGQPESVAMAEAIPGLVAAMSKTMACKEMCEAAVSSCSCKADGSDALTFGEAITNAEQVEDGFQKLGLQTLGEDFKTTLFRDIWDKPVCDIFTSKDDPDFGGYCDADVIGDKAQCTKTNFCDGLNDEQRAGTETIIATQLAKSVFAFVEGPAGIIQQRSSSTQVAKSGGLDKVPGFKKPGTGVNPTPTTTTPTSGFTSSTTEEVTSVEIPMPEASETEKKGGSLLGSVFGTLVGLAVLAGVAAFGWKKYQEHQARQMGEYRPMDFEAIGDDGIPLA